MPLGNIENFAVETGAEDKLTSILNIVSQLAHDIKELRADARLNDSRLAELTNRVNILESKNNNLSEALVVSEPKN